MLTQEMDEEMDELKAEKTRADKLSDFFDVLADAYCDLFGARALMALAIDSGFEKDDILNYFIDDEELYESMIEEKISD